MEGGASWKRSLIKLLSRPCVIFGSCPQTLALHTTTLTRHTSRDTTIKYTDLLYDIYVFLCVCICLFLFVYVHVVLNWCVIHMSQIIDDGSFLCQTRYPAVVCRLVTCLSNSISGLGSWFVVWFGTKFARLVRGSQGGLLLPEPRL